MSDRATSDVPSIGDGKHAAAHASRQGPIDRRWERNRRADATVGAAAPSLPIPRMAAQPSSLGPSRYNNSLRLSERFSPPARWGFDSRRRERPMPKGRPGGSSTRRCDAPPPSGPLARRSGWPSRCLDYPRSPRARTCTVGELLTSNASAPLSVVWPRLLSWTALAMAGARAGWTAAAVGLVCGALTPLVSGRWSAVVNPVHRLAAGLWLGSLFIMVACGLTPLLRNAELGERRGALAADMVNRFSPMALSMGGVVVAFGVLTAWLHLPTVASLWGTPYGRTLIIKLVFVATVFALGAFNWRRQRPTLGKESAATSIRRSATLSVGRGGRPHRHVDSPQPPVAQASSAVAAALSHDSGDRRLDAGIGVCYCTSVRLTGDPNMPLIHAVLLCATTAGWPCHARPVFP